MNEWMGEYNKYKGPIINYNMLLRSYIVSVYINARIYDSILPYSG